MSRVADVYGQALYELSVQENCVEDILPQLQTLQTAFAEEGDFIRLLSAHNLTKAERLRIVDDSFAGRVAPFVVNFIKLLTEKGYMRDFSGCCDTFVDLYRRDHGIVSVTAVTAVEMTDDQLRRLTEKLEQMTGKRIELTNAIDPSCMGGVRLDYDGKRVDDTVLRRLDSIRSILKNTVL